MFVDHFQLAVNGLGPGLTTYSVATTGYVVEIVVTPPGYVHPNEGTTGAGSIAGYIPYPKREKLKVTVTLNGRSWEEEFEEIDIPSFLLDEVTVTAESLGVKRDIVTASFVKYMINSDNMIIKVTKL